MTFLYFGVDGLGEGTSWNVWSWHPLVERRVQLGLPRRVALHARDFASYCVGSGMAEPCQAPALGDEDSDVSAAHGMNRAWARLELSDDAVLALDALARAGAFSPY